MEGLRRNALIVLANGKHTNALPVIRKVFQNDSDPVVRATALWAARSLGDESLTAEGLADPEPLVRTEAGRERTDSIMGVASSARMRYPH